MTLLVRDNEDILDAHLRYHFAAGVDFVIATDNLSVDGSGEILRAYERDGRLRRLEERADVYDFARWTTRMARLAATEHRADWVINSDVDEFWWPEAGTLKHVLGALPRWCGAASATRTNFVPRPPSGEDFYDAMTVRETVSLTVAGKPLPGKVCHRAFRNIDVAHGSHGVFRRGRLGRRRLRARPVPISILHFPVRSYAQLAWKIEKGGPALARNRELNRGVGYTWRMLHELLLRGELESYYDDLVKDDGAVARGLADGTLVVDDRLSRAFAGIDARQDT